MIKQLIILSLTFLLISCGEKEETTQEETIATTSDTSQTELIF